MARPLDLVRVGGSRCECVNYYRENPGIGWKLVNCPDPSRICAKFFASSSLSCTPVSVRHKLFAS